MSDRRLSARPPERARRHLRCCHACWQRVDHFIEDGSEPTVEERTAPISLIFSSLRPKGYQRGVFAEPQRRSRWTYRTSPSSRYSYNPRCSNLVSRSPPWHLLIVAGSYMLGGFGVRELGEPELIDEHTLFMAASNTKGMTTLLLAELVDEKKLAWEQPVTQVYPSFKLGDSETTKKVLIKNLVCACTGLPRQDLEWIFASKNVTPESILALIGTMQPTSKFGEVFQYSNLMVSAAGYIGAHLVYPNLELGAAYDEAMQKKVFDPLGMKSTTFDFARALAENHGSPHADDVDGRPTVANMAFNYSVVPARPAGGVWTSADDLIRYVQLELALGKLPNGKRLVSPENLLERHAPQIAHREDSSYGMGLEVDQEIRHSACESRRQPGGLQDESWLLPPQLGHRCRAAHQFGQWRHAPASIRPPLAGGVVYRRQDQRRLAIVASAASTHKASIAKERERLVVPTEPAFVAHLATRYSSKELGELDCPEHRRSNHIRFRRVERRGGIAKE